MRRQISFSLFVLSCSLSLPFAEETRFQVKHDHGIRSCGGELVFRDDGMEYVTSHKKDARTWNYVDIQQLGLIRESDLCGVSYTTYCSPSSSVPWQPPRACWCLTGS